MGERLLCKQEVVGSIPSASRCARRGVMERVGFGFRGLDHCRWAGFGVRGLKCVCVLYGL